MKTSTIILIALLLPLCIACKKDAPGVDIRPQFHFINFTDASGQNLFASGKIPTSKFHSVAGDNKYSWEQLMEGKENKIAGIVVDRDVLDKINRDNEFLLLEVSAGYIERDEIFSINGVEYSFRLSLKEGFYQNGKKLEHSTEVIDKYAFYVHHVILEEY